MCNMKQSGITRGQLQVKRPLHYSHQLFDLTAVQTATQKENNGFIVGLTGKNISCFLTR